MARSNELVAEALGELSELLAITGEDQFRVRAYEKAARSVAEYPLDVDTLDEKALDDIPAVGSHIATKIRELLASGRLSELDDLRARVPAGLRSLLDVPGLGPKRARQVYEELGVSSLPELLDALHQEKLRGLKGWGPTSEQNLRRAMAQAQQAGGRMQLGVAVGIAEELAGDLRELPEAQSVAYAGSLRRMCETIGDIDLLVASDHPEAVMECFAHLPLVEEVASAGRTKSTALTTKGVHVDLRVVDPKVWGAALLYFTGSKAHNIHLRRIAQRHDMKLSEYGLERTEDSSVVAAGTEEDIYAALGMSWVPPPLREDRGEIELALEGELPCLVEVSDLRGDLHMHTNLTDGVSSLEEMVDASVARGYEYVAITDHAPLLYMERMTAEKALEQRQRLSALQERVGIALLHGSELNILPDGSVDWDEGFLAGFDVLVGSVHSHFTMSRREMTKRLIAAVENPQVNIIGHPTSRSIGRRQPIEFDAKAVFDAAARAGTAFEINSFPDRLDLDDELARLAQDRGVRLAISTDAHSTRHLDNIRYGVGTAQRGWILPENVINTWPLERLRAFMDKRCAATR